VSRLIEAIAAAARGTGKVTVRTFDASTGGRRDGCFSWTELHAEARGLAARLGAAGVGAGCAVGIVGSTSRTLLASVQAAWLAGASVTLLAPPNGSGGLDALVDTVVTAVRRAQLDVVVLCPPFVGAAGSLAVAGCQVIEFDDAAGAASVGLPFTQPRLAESDVALRQFTSGSTGPPRAVRITHGNLMANLAATRAASRHDDVHRAMVSWLPPHHDMGLIGFLILPMTCGDCGLFLSSPEEFLARPRSWLDDLSTLRATATAAPCFAYGIAARLAHPGKGLDLSALRVAIVGSDPVDPAVMSAFADRARAYRFDPEALVCAFGMAEATLAVSMREPGTGMAVDLVDADSLEKARFAHPAAGGARVAALARLGRPVPGIEVQVADPDTGAPRAERAIGELRIRGDSVTSGYVVDGRPDDFDGDWFRTGDLGYLLDGEIVVCGRRKELVIVGGRNILPYEVERAAARVEGVRPGRVAAFQGAGRGAGHGAGETLVVALETRAGEHPGLREAVAREIIARVGVRPAEVLLLAPGTLPKTTSGKMRRVEIRRRYLAGEGLREVARP
jgi:fatty-acyl-CoA synthase